MVDVAGVRRQCAEKRGAYLHARELYLHARRIPRIDASALRDELSQALLDYYAAHGALHAALRSRGQLN